MSRPSRRTTALATLLLVSLAAVLVAPTLWRCPRCWSELYDWHYFQAMEDVFRLSVAQYHQLIGFACFCNHGPWQPSDAQALECVVIYSVG